MTKSEELQAITHFTTSLPKDSYLRPWLESILPGIEAEIRCDFPVSPSLANTRIECQQLITAAKAQAQTIITQATQAAAALDQKAKANRKYCTDLLIGNLHICLRKLGCD